MQGMVWGSTLIDSRSSDAFRVVACQQSKGSCLVHGQNLCCPLFGLPIGFDDINTGVHCL